MAYLCDLMKELQEGKKIVHPGMKFIHGSYYYLNEDGYLMYHSGSENTDKPGIIVLSRLFDKSDWEIYPEPLTFEVGKKYKNRRGDVYLIVAINPEFSEPITVRKLDDTSTGVRYSNGRASVSREYEIDLTEEVK